VPRGLRSLVEVSACRQTVKRSASARRPRRFSENARVPAYTLNDNVVGHACEGRRGPRHSSTAGVKPSTSTATRASRNASEPVGLRVRRSRRFCADARRCRRGPMVRDLHGLDGLVRAVRRRRGHERRLRACGRQLRYSTTSSRTARSLVESVSGSHHPGRARSSLRPHGRRNAAHYGFARPPMPPRRR
jgi:hypothetical protein